MHINVLLFSSLRESVGVSSLEVELDTGTTGDGLVEALGHSHPGIRQFASVLRIARNSEYVDGSCVIEEGDEVALITPVSGG